MNDIIEVPDQQQLKTIGHISYFMHAVVAVGAVLPGVQASVLLLLIAFFLDMFKRDDARGTWQESHFSWRIRSVLWAGGLYLVTAPLWLLFLLPGWIAGRIKPSAFSLCREKASPHSAGIGIRRC